MIRLIIEAGDLKKVRGWLRPKAAAQYCNVGERTLRAWLKEADLRSSKVKGTVLIKIEWLDDFIQKHEVVRNNDVERVVEEICQELKE